VVVVVRVRVVVVAIFLCASAAPTWAQTPPDDDLRAAKIAYNAAQFRAAGDDVERALAVAPDDPDVLAMHAPVASRLGDEATSIASARRAIELGARGRATTSSSRSSRERRACHVAASRTGSTGVDGASERRGPGRASRRW
jgi:hypothetical protein